MAENEVEFTFTPADFERVRRLLYGHSEVLLAGAMRSMVYHRLAARLRTCRVERFADYLDIVECDRAEYTACVNALTAELSSFFGQPEHFAILADYVRSRHLPRLRVWCAAASAGEEPYSIAMALVEAYGTDSPPVEIIASDIDTAGLTHAQRGVYALERLTPVSTARRARFFQRGDGPNTGFARVAPALRTMIDYRQIDLRSDDWALPGKLDVIFCRNVLRYFDLAAQQRIMARFAARLGPDGLLVTGAVERVTTQETLSSLRRSVNVRRRPALTPN